MMNLYQYAQAHLQSSKHTKKAEEYNAFLTQRQSFKVKAERRRNNRLQDFLDQYTKTDKHYIFHDQYMTPLIHNKEQEMGNSLIQSLQLINGTGTNSSIDRYKRTSLELTQQKGHSQPKQRLQLTAEDKQLLTYQPALKPNRLNESAKTFNAKANQLMENYQRDRQRYEQVLRVSKDRHRLCQVTHFDQSFPRGSSLNPSNLKAGAHNQEESEQYQKSMYMSQVGERRQKEKTYFKLAKRAQLFSKDRQSKEQLDHLLSRSHYNRIKKHHKDELLNSGALTGSFFNERGRKSLQLSQLA